MNSPLRHKPTCCSLKLVIWAWRLCNFFWRSGFCKTEISVFENISQKLRRRKTIETQHTETFWSKEAKIYFTCGSVFIWWIRIYKNWEKTSVKSQPRTKLEPTAAIYAFTRSSSELMGRYTQQNWLNMYRVARSSSKKFADSFRRQNTHSRPRML